MNRKIGILTFHNACNYGAVLQAYALRKYLREKLHADAEIINYRNNLIEDEYAVFDIRAGNNVFKEIITSILCAGYRINRNLAFQAFGRKYLGISNEVLNKHTLSVLAQDYDSFITGSDQVWNLGITGNDHTFFLDFVQDKSKCFSYAASIGKSTFSDAELAAIAELLVHFNGISFREKELVSVFQPVLQDKRVLSCLDPVYLLTGNEWRAIKENKEQRRPYVLFFTTGNHPGIVPAIEFAKKLAKDKGMDILFLSDQDKWFKHRKMRHCGAATPTDFIRLIDDAAYVVTNSFHATSFSIILHTKFYVETGLSRNGRMKNILELTGLENRQLHHGVPVCESDFEIDWKKIDNKINVLKKQSEEYLSEIANS